MTRMISPIPALLAALLLTFVPTAIAQIEDSHIDPDRVGDPEPWIEPGFDRPRYPKDSDLIKTAGEPTSTLQMYVDRSSVEVKNEMTRLVYVLESKSGARSVLVEGFRCSKYFYKTYATAGGDGKLYPAKNPQWAPVDRAATQNNFRLQLLQNYVCDFMGINREPRDVLRLVRFPEYDPDHEQQ